VVNWYFFPFWYFWTKKNLATLVSPIDKIEGSSIFVPQLDAFARHEDAVRVATSLFGLVAQDFRIDKVISETKVTTVMFAI
jgi:hypothetical protein